MAVAPSTSDTGKSDVAKKVRKSRPRPINALAFTVWADNGAPLSPEVQKQFEDAIQLVQFELFNEGTRILTQTTRG